MPGLCEKHFRQREECCSSRLCKATDIQDVEPYLHLIPRSYDAWCGECRVCKHPYWCEPDGGTGNFAVEDSRCGFSPWGPPFICGCGRNPLSYGRDNAIECEDHRGQWAWYGVYFSAEHHRYFRFFKEHLRFCSENTKCRRFWPEVDKKAEEISNTVFEALLALVEDGFLNAKYDEHWDPDEPFEWASSLCTYPCFYSHYYGILKDVCSFIDGEAVRGESESGAIGSVYEALDDIQPLFLDLYSECIECFPHPKLRYERGLIHSHRGETTKAAHELERFINEAEEQHLDHWLTPDVYHTQGQMYLDCNAYDRAIEHITKAIQKDPKRRDLYLSRASCYLEMGEIDFAIVDYFASGFQERARPDYICKPNQIQFFKGFCSGIGSGCVEATKEFVPSLLGSLHGIGKCLWALSPLSGADLAALEICDDVLAIIDHIRETSSGELLQELIPDIRHIIDLPQDEQFDAKLGYHMGHLIGKHGLEVLSCVGTTKMVSRFANAMRVNRLATLDAVAAQETRATVAKAMVDHAANRQAILKSGNFKIEWGDQNKHIRGHHFWEEERLRSAWSHPDPQGLVNEWFGRGVPDRGVAGVAGYKEIVDFGLVIGEFYDARLKAYIPTTRGKIHYSKKGCHIVPAPPEAP